jgi:hypothetical protein
MASWLLHRDSFCNDTKLNFIMIVCASDFLAENYMISKRDLDG